MSLSELREMGLVGAPLAPPVAAEAIRTTNHRGEEHLAFDVPTSARMGAHVLL